MAQRSPRGSRARVVSLRSLAAQRLRRQAERSLEGVSARAQVYSDQASQWVARAASLLCAPRPVPAPVRRAALETLERRQLLSSVSFAQGTLVLTGNPTGTNTFSVDLSGGSVAANVDGHGIAEPQSSVRSIRITGGSGTDSIYVNPAITAPASISTGAGNDTIKGGSAIDSIAAGDGNDLIFGSGTIDAGNGSDQVHIASHASHVTLGSGNDIVYGGPGGDTITATGGSDQIYGGSANDSITATGGNEYLDGGGGNDTLTSGSGNDTLIGGPGIDHLNAGTGSNSYPDLTSQDFAPAGVIKTVASSVPTAAPAAGSTGLSQGGSVAEDRTVTGTNRGSTVPLPVINVRGTTGMAEQSVFVDALNSTLGAGTALTASYQWNFGDPGSAYNVLPGWNAGHVYSNPGVYTITLTITNQAGQSNSLSTQVTVTANTRRTLYVDSVSGNDRNAGTSPSQALRTPAGAEALLGSNTTVLFRRGETFTFDQTMNLNFREIEVGAYGSGAAPVMMKVPGAATSGTGIFWTGPSSDEVVIENLTFDSVYTPVGNIAGHIPAVGVFAGGRNITVRNNTFLNIDDAVNSYSGPDGVLVQNNTCPLPTGLRGYLDYINGSDAVILGNTVANSTREHVIRSTDDTTQRVLIAGNNLDNSYNRQSVDPLDFPKTTINIRAGHYVYITDNVLSDGMAGFGPGPWTPASDSCEWVVLDGNVFHNAQLYVAGNVHHLIARNNLFDIQDTAQIQIHPLDPDFASRYMSDVTITNNTGVTGSQKGAFLELDGTSPAGIITVTNNLFAAPNFQPGEGFASPVYVRATDLSAFRQFDGNIWPAPTSLNKYKVGGVNYVSVGLSMLAYLTPQEWNSLGNVGSDSFARVVLPGGSFQASNGRILVGAVLPPPLR